VSPLVSAAGNLAFQLAFRPSSALDHCQHFVELAGSPFLQETLSANVARA
jgi:hypothetical protein